LPEDTEALAGALIGKLLVRDLPEGLASGRIVETEAYVIGDAAGHAYRGMTPRNRALFLERGHAYVYLAYGVSWMLNVSSEAKGVGAGVLIRALEPLEGIAIMQRNREPNACAIWREARDGSPRRSGSIARSMGSISARRARSGLHATITSPAPSARARGSALPARQTACCGSICGAAHSSAASGRSTNRKAHRRRFSGWKPELPLRAPPERVQIIAEIQDSWYDNRHRARRKVGTGAGISWRQI
jgi:hypothetical protein